MTSLILLLLKFFNIKERLIKEPRTEITVKETIWTYPYMLHMGVTFTSFVYINIIDVNDRDALAVYLLLFCSWQDKSLQLTYEILAMSLNKKLIPYSLYASANNSASFA